MAVRSATKSSARSIQTRLEESSQSVEGYYAAYVDEIEVRDAIILQGDVEGIPHTQLAEWGRVTPTRITQIIARRWPR